MGKVKSPIFNNSGFGLIEVMVAGAIMTIITLGITSFMVNAQKDAKHIQQLSDANDLMKSINTLLANPAVCKANFGTGPGAIVAGTTVLTADITNDIGTVIYDVANPAAVYGNNQFNITGYTITAPSPPVTAGPPANIILQLAVSLTKANNTGSGPTTLAPRIISLDAVLLGGVGTAIDTCHAVGVAAVPGGTFWDIYTDGTSILNNNTGAVAIGMGPGEVLKDKLAVDGNISINGAIGFNRNPFDGSIPSWGNVASGRYQITPYPDRFNIETYDSGTGANTGIFSMDPVTGNAGIGLSGAAEKLHVNGNVAVIAGYGFMYSSDRKLKKDLVPIKGLDVINGLTGYHFNWKENNKKDIGVIAQEVEVVLPEAVQIRADGTRTVDYPKLVAPLIQAIKEQQQQISELKKQVEELQKQGQRNRKAK